MFEINRIPAIDSISYLNYYINISTAKMDKREHS